MKVKELLELITVKSFSITEKRYLMESIWEVVIDQETLNLSERFSLNRGAYWVLEDKDGVVYSTYMT